MLSAVSPWISLPPDIPHPKTCQIWSSLDMCTDSKTQGVVMASDQVYTEDWFLEWLQTFTG